MILFAFQFIATHQGQQQGMKCPTEGQTEAIIPSKSGAPFVEASIDGELYDATICA